MHEASAGRNPTIDAIATHLEQVAFQDRESKLPDWISQDLTFGQLRVLMIVQRTGPISIGTLAERLGVSLASASETIDRLERHELVMRRHRTDDRRVVECLLSDRGEALVEEIAGLRMDAMHRMLGVLTEEELADFDRLIRLIGTRLDATRARSGI